MAKDRKIAWVYLVTNLKNSKYYVGITRKDSVERRWRDHITFAERGGKTHFAKAIRKYGEAKFEISVLECCDAYDDLSKNYADAQEFEKMYIEYFDSIDTGYNMAFGGGGAVGPSLAATARRPSNTMCLVRLLW